MDGYAWPDQSIGDRAKRAKHESTFLREKQISKDMQMRFLGKFLRKSKVCSKSCINGPFSLVTPQLHEDLDQTGKNL